MIDYKKNIEDLRHADNLTSDHKLLGVCARAADAIEELQAAEPTEKQVVDYCHKRCFVVIEADLFHEMKASYGKMPKRGEWELIDGTEPMRWGCSRCKYMSWETSNYCPRCGAKMEVQE